MLWLADDDDVEEVIFNIHKTNIECFYDNVMLPIWIMRIYWDICK